MFGRQEPNGSRSKVERVSTALPIADDSKKEAASPPVNLPAVVKPTEKPVVVATKAAAVEISALRTKVTVRKLSEYANPPKENNNK